MEHGAHTREQKKKSGVFIAFCFILHATCFMLFAQPAYANPVASESVFNDFKFQVPFPGLSITQDQFNSGDAIGIYITKIYKWFVVFALIAAVLAFIYAGVLWLTARGDSGQVGESKKILVNSIVGVVLILGSYTLLWAVNPDLVAFKSLQEMKGSVTSLKLDFTPADQGVCCYNYKTGLETIGTFAKGNIQSCKQLTTSTLDTAAIVWCPPPATDETVCGAKGGPGGKRWDISSISCSNKVTVK